MAQHFVKARQVIDSIQQHILTVLLLVLVVLFHGSANFVRLVERLLSWNYDWLTHADAEEAEQ